MNCVLENVQVFDGESDRGIVNLAVEDGLIVELGNFPPSKYGHSTCQDLEGLRLIPGFNDLQVNGGGGLLFNDHPSVAAIRTIAKAHRQFGTTGFLPTVISDDVAVMSAAVAAVAQAIRERVPGVLGIHFEGPSLNSSRRGVHPKANLRNLDEEVFSVMTSLSQGKTLVTLAPEIVALKDIQRLKQAGVVVFAGHSAATYEQTKAALNSGISGFTHLFNAMPPMMSREPGIVGAALEDTNSWNGIIADGHHLHPATIRIALAVKQAGHTFLVTDAMPSVGSTSQTFEIGGEKITVKGDVCLTADGTLAGAHLDMFTAVNNMQKFTEVDFLEAVRMASCYPASALGLSSQLGFIKPGYKANFIALDKTNKITQTWIDGV